MSWSDTTERGGALPLQVMLWLVRHANRFATRVVLPGVTAWYYASSPTARAASRQFLAAALGRPVRGRDVLHHLHVFAQAIVDRVLLLTGLDRRITVAVDGMAEIQAVVAAGSGCLLLGGHLGSFEVLGRLAQDSPVAVKALMYQDNAGALTRMLARLPSQAATAVMPVGDVQSMVRMHEAVSAGAILGILADRAPAGARTVTAPFFGRPAAFPAGPFVLAASLGVPVLTFYAVRTGRHRYQIRIERFADRVELARATREADLAAVVSRYAAWLERGCRAYPFNWFNFYPFWEDATHDPTQAARRRAVRGAARSGGTAGAGASTVPAG